MAKAGVQERVEIDQRQDMVAGTVHPLEATAYSLPCAHWNAPPTAPAAWQHAPRL